MSLSIKCVSIAVIIVLKRNQYTREIIRIVHEILYKVLDLSVMLLIFFNHLKNLSYS